MAADKLYQEPKEWAKHTDQHCSTRQILVVITVLRYAGAIGMCRLKPTP